MLTPQIASFIATEAIPAGARVKFTSGSVVAVELADAADREIGIAILHSGKSSYAAGDPVGVFMRFPTVTLYASGAFSAGATLRRMVDGGVDDTGTGAPFAIALEAATAAGDFIEGLLLDAPVAPGLYALVSTNGTAGAAADLAALKAETELLGDDVRAIHAALVTAGILRAS